MKRSILTLAPILAFFHFTALSCADNDSFVNVKAIETQIYSEIKSHRIESGISENDFFVHQFIMVKEAQLFSAKQAYAAGDSDTTGISLHWDVIHNKIGGYNDMTLLKSTTSTSATDIVANWTSDSTTNAMLLKDYTQCGVGVEYGADNMAYITVLMMKADSPSTQ
ncbi:MAG: hypothetical protein LC655_04705 [Bacteroidales bacterium]|nr:hypothetical protein [Bacteroidales bacterium]